MLLADLRMHIAAGSNELSARAAKSAVISVTIRMSNSEDAILPVLWPASETLECMETERHASPDKAISDFADQRANFLLYLGLFG